MEKILSKGSLTTVAKLGKSNRKWGKSILNEAPCSKTSASSVEPLQGIVKLISLPLFSTVQ
jgi:hypothetical protein